jgi:hypothetical protein
VTQRRAILIGGLVVGVLDLLDAMAFFGLRGIPPGRILQSIAAGLLGPAGFGGGAGTALLGLALHFSIALTIVTTYVLASRRLPALWRHPFRWGPIYGLAVYLTMNYVVIPLSAASPRSLTFPVVVNGILIHLVGVGLPAALAARAARSAEI